MLERGEYVLNRKAVKAAGGRRSLDAFNFGTAARFQQGGMAGMVAAANKLNAAQFPYVWGGGHQASPAPFGPMDCSGAVSFVLQHGGVPIPTMVSGALMGAGAPGPGKVTVFANPVHTFMRLGSNYFGTSGQNPGGGAGWFSDPGAAYRAGFAQRHFEGMGAVADAIIPKITIGGTDSPLKDMVQGAIDRTRSAAQSRLDQLSAQAFGGSAGGGDVGDAGPGGDFSKNALKQLWNRAGGAPSVANLAAAVALAESGGLSTAQNINSDGSIDRGLWQINSVHGNLSTFDPFANAKAAVKISSGGTDWNPWTTFKSGAYQKFLQLGGLVGMQGGGDPFGWADVLTRRPGKPQRAPGYGRSLKEQMNRAVNIVGGLNPKGKRFPAKQRSRVLRRFLKRIQGLNLGKEMQRRIKKLTDDAEIYGDYASRASALTIEDESGQSIPGMANGKTEIEWLNLQLETLFKLRNRLIEAEQVIAKKQEAVAGLIERGSKRLNSLSDQIRVTARARGKLEDHLKELRKHPSKNKDAIKDVKKQIDAIDKAQGVRSRERDVLTGRIMPSLRDQRTSLRGTRSELMDSLNTVQGVGSPMKVLTSLPELGVLGGSIFDVQMRLRDLNAPKQSITDTDESADLLRELLRQANLRTAVSETALRTFREASVDPFLVAARAGGGLPFAGAFQQGGVIPGSPSQAYSAVVHGGETITPASAAAGSMPVQVIIHPGMEWLERYIEVKVDGQTRKSTQRGPLPGRGGGLQR